MSPKSTEVRTLSGKERVLLELLADGGAMYGLQLVARSQGQLKRGTVYVTLGRMEQKGLVSSERDEQSSPSAVMPRRLYRATAFGMRVLDVWALAARALAWGDAR